MSGIFNDPKVITRGKGAKLIDVHHEATDMYRNHTDDVSSTRNTRERRASPNGLEFLRCVAQIHVQCSGIAVDKDGNPTFVPNDLCSGRKSKGRNKDGLILLEAE